MDNIKVEYVDVDKLQLASYNPRKWNEKKTNELSESIKKFGFVDPLIVNSAPKRLNIVIGGHFRLHLAKKLGFDSVPVVYINIPDIEKEKELNLRLNKNTGDWDLDLLSKFDSSLLTNIGFSSEDIDDIFQIDETPEQFDLEKELRKLNIQQIKIKKGDIYDLDGSRLMCGDSTVDVKYPIYCNSIL